jgi:hypothetical protein
VSRTDMALSWYSRSGLEQRKCLKLSGDAAGRLLDGKNYEKMDVYRHAQNRECFPSFNVIVLLKSIEATLASIWLVMIYTNVRCDYLIGGRIGHAIARLISAVILPLTLLNPKRGGLQIFEKHQ